ncbi:MAG: hypothetical protein B6244_13135 [Candidatus Cloacimonetes bacterium 4572_55]|nr:MAG: hypothetical protein B6244_13135 [Candidatus Cloacimonetes bacterium 4572_55]
MRSDRRYRNLWNELENISNQVGHAFFEVFEADRGRDMTSTTHPFLDIMEKEGELWVMIELPGLSKDDVQIRFESNILTVTGEIKPVDPEGRRVIRSERSHGKFKRNVRVQYQVDTEKISAEMNHGLLVVYLPKHQAAKAKTIHVEVR